jgi:hypothetical protein
MGEKEKKRKKKRNYFPKPTKHSIGFFPIDALVGVSSL